MISAKSPLSAGLAACLTLTTVAAPAAAAPNVGAMEDSRVRTCYERTLAATELAPDDVARTLRPYADAFAERFAVIGQGAGLPARPDMLVEDGERSATIREYVVAQAKICALESEARGGELLANQDIAGALLCYGVAAARNRRDEADAPWVRYLLAQILKEQGIPGTLWYVLQEESERVGRQRETAVEDDLVNQCLSEAALLLQIELALDLHAIFAARPASPERDAAITMLEIGGSPRYLLCNARSPLEPGDQADLERAVANHLSPDQEPTAAQEAEAGRIVERATGYFASHLEAQPELDDELGLACAAAFS